MTRTKVHMQPTPSFDLDREPLLAEGPIPANVLAEQTYSPVELDDEEEQSKEALKIIALTFCLLALLFGTVYAANEVHKHHHHFGDNDDQNNETFHGKALAEIWKEHIINVGLFKPTSSTAVDHRPTKTAHLVPRRSKTSNIVHII